MTTQKRAANTLISICANARENENILIVTDNASQEIAHLIWNAAEHFPNKTMMRMNDRVMHGNEPPRTVAAAMMAADVIFGVTKFSMLHTAARRNAVANGARFVNMPDYSLAMVESGGLFADFVEQGKLMDRVSDILEGDSIRIATAKGTDFTASIKNRKATRQYGRSLTPGTSSSPPDIETALAPVEGTSNGTIVIDGSIPHPLLGKLKETITLFIVNGRIAEIEGGHEAGILKGIMHSFNDEMVYHVGEIGIGFNDQSTICNIMLEDEGAMGTAHFGFGSNISFGGTIESNNHLDMVYYSPTIVVDNRSVMREGQPVL